MRHVVKSVPPACLSEWIQEKVNAAEPVDYRDFSRGAELRQALLTEQLGLCAYTGRKVKEFQVTVEHMKPYAVCKRDQATSGATEGDDVDYFNLIATHRTYGKPLYGEAVRGSWFDANYVFATDPQCGTHFDFDEYGEISGLTPEGREMISRLRLDDKLLTEDRFSAIIAAEKILYGMLDLGGTMNQFLNLFQVPIDGSLPSFAFVIEKALPKLQMKP